MAAWFFVLGAGPCVVIDHVAHWKTRLIFAFLCVSKWSSLFVCALGHDVSDWSLAFSPTSVEVRSSCGPTANSSSTLTLHLPARSFGRHRYTQERTHWERFESVRLHFNRSRCSVGFECAGSTLPPLRPTGLNRPAYPPQQSHWCLPSDNHT